MSDAEKMARLCTDLDRRSVVVEYDLSKPIAENMREAAALIRRLQAENEALRVKQAGLVEALMPLVDAAHGLSFGTDWNNGTQAKLHGHRQKLIDAVPRARAAIEVNRE
jgi:hypothetical protein